jgi:hypothetical protein
MEDAAFCCQKFSENFRGQRVTIEHFPPFHYIFSIFHLESCHIKYLYYVIDKIISLDLSLVQWILVIFSPVPAIFHRHIHEHPDTRVP